MAGRHAPPLSEGRLPLHLSRAFPSGNLNKCLIAAALQEKDEEIFSSTGGAKGDSKGGTEFFNSVPPKGKRTINRESF
jgi:hypothetical protein